MRAIVCGTRFGQVYLESFRRPDNPMELAGVYASGSARSRAVADLYAVPLYTRLSDLPTDIDVACVVIRGGLLGGPGTRIALALMERGVHVLQEHPLHGDELRECLRQARRQNVRYRVNSFYVHTEPLRGYAAAAEELLRDQRLVYLDAACGFQLSYSLLDILAGILGNLKPWSFVRPGPGAGVFDAAAHPPPFRSLDGVLGGIPTVLRVQNQIDPADPDGFSHLMHKISLGFEAGSLDLSSSHGPISWQARPAFPHVAADEGAHFADAADPSGQTPSALVLGPSAAPGFEEAFSQYWPAGVVRVLHDLGRAIENGGSDTVHAQRQLAVCELWQELTALLGPPRLLSGEQPRPVGDEQLAALHRAVRGGGER